MKGGTVPVFPQKDMWIKLQIFPDFHLLSEKIFRISDNIKSPLLAHQNHLFINLF